MTANEAAAIVQLIHINMGDRALSFYALAETFGHDLHSTSNLMEVGWHQSPETRDRMRKKSALLFRAIADAFDKPCREGQ